jgi:hypothetical protein
MIYGALRRGRNCTRFYNDDSAEEEDQAVPSAAIETLTIPEAKRLLALSLGVPESAIKISIEH